MKTNEGMLKLLDRRDRANKKLRAQVRETQAEVVALADKLDKALVLYDAARGMIRHSQDTEVKNARRVLAEQAASRLAACDALAVALKNEIEARVASLDVGIAEADLLAEQKTILNLLGFWPFSRKVIPGLPGADVAAAPEPSNGDAA